MRERIRRQKGRQEGVWVLCEVKQTLRRPCWWLTDRPHSRNVPYVIGSLLLRSLMTPKLSVQVLKHSISIVTLFSWLLCVGGGEAHPGVGGNRREGVPNLSLCQNRNKRKATRCRGHQKAGNQSKAGCECNRSLGNTLWPSKRQEMGILWGSSLPGPKGPGGPT